MAQQVRTFETSTTALRYLLHVPSGKEKGRRWPLILSLHDAGERGSDIELVRHYGIPHVADNDPAFPYIAVSPQCPLGTMWTFQLEALNSLVEHLINAHPIDPDRIYVTGFGMGGYGTWNMAVAYPERFAGIAPVCGGGDPDTVCAIRHLPVWAFHGALDNVVLIRESRKMVDSLRECGGRVRFTIYPNAGHDSWTRTYANPRLYEWFSSHTRGEQIEPAAT